MKRIVCVTVSIFLASIALGAEPSTAALRAQVEVTKVWTQAKTAWERGDI